MYDLTTIDPIEIHPDLRALLMKLRHCQDSRTSTQSFVGAIRVEIVEGIPVLHIEETVWDTTDSGDKINTNALRA